MCQVSYLIWQTAKSPLWLHPRFHLSRFDRRRNPHKVALIYMFSGPAWVCSANDVSIGSDRSFAFAMWRQCAPRSNTWFFGTTRVQQRLTCGSFVMQCVRCSLMVTKDCDKAALIPLGVLQSQLWRPSRTVEPLSNNGNSLKHANVARRCRVLIRLPIRVIYYHHHLIFTIIIQFVAENSRFCASHPCVQHTGTQTTLHATRVGKSRTAPYRTLCLHYRLSRWHDYSVFSPDADEAFSAERNRLTKTCRHIGK